MLSTQINLFNIHSQGCVLSLHLMVFTIRMLEIGCQEMTTSDIEQVHIKTIHKQNYYHDDLSKKIIIYKINLIL